MPEKPMSEYHKINPETNEFFNPKTGETSFPLKQEEPESYFSQLAPGKQKTLMDQINEMHDKGEFKHLSPSDTEEAKNNLMQKWAKEILEKREQK